MEIKGTLFKICPTVDINLKAGGTMQKGGFVINYTPREGDFPKSLYFELMGADRIAQLNGLVPGMLLQVYFYVESREGRDGRFFTSMRCTHVVRLKAPADMPTTNGFPQNTPPPAPHGDNAVETADEAPF